MADRNAHYATSTSGIVEDIQFHGDDGRKDDDERSRTSKSSQRSNRSLRSLGKGMKSMGKSMKKIFSPKKRRRRRKGNKGSGDSSDDDDGSYDVSNDSSLGGGGGGRNFTNQMGEEWVAGGRGGGGGGRRRVEQAAAANANPNYNKNRLPSVVEGENEDYDSDMFDSPLKNSTRNRRSKRFLNNKKSARDNTSSSSVSSQNGSRQNNNNNNNARGGAAVAPAPSQPPSPQHDDGEADSLSLVILLIDPLSLRFELLSLDFDLAVAVAAAQLKHNKKKKKKKKGFRKMKNNTKNDDPSLSSLSLTVQDVLDQITPDSLTEETLKTNMMMTDTNKVPIGLIDRKEQIHYGSVSLDEACAARPLRSSHSRPVPSSLWNLTYTGEAHRDVLLGFFGDPATDGGDVSNAAGSAAADASSERIRKALALAKPIFNDNHVVQMMESNGYNLMGWSDKASSSTGGTTTAHSNSASHVNDNNIEISASADTIIAGSAANNNGSSTGTPPRSMAMLREPLPPKKRIKNWMEYGLVKFMVAVLVIVLSTITAWSIVSGGVYVLPAISSVAATIGSPGEIERLLPPPPSSNGRIDTIDGIGGAAAASRNTNNNYQPETFEGWIKLGFDSVSSWMYQKIATNTLPILIVTEEDGGGCDNNNNNDVDDDDDKDVDNSLSGEDDDIIDLDQM